MGKASSAKKVARAARAGGKTPGQRRNLGFPAAIVVIVLLGVGLVAFARNNAPGGGSPELGEHWHAAYGIFVCDRWVANLPDGPTDQLGIHTHDDGLIHIHPFLAGAAGRSATLGRFFEQVGMSVTDSSITLPPGDQFGHRAFVKGETTCGGEAARVVMGRWNSAMDASGKPDEVRTSGISGQHLDNDLAAYTIAFLPEGESIPPPPSAATILESATADGPIDTQGDDGLTEEELREQFEGGGAGSTGSDELPIEEIPTEEVPTDGSEPAEEPATDPEQAPADEGTAPEETPVDEAPDTATDEG